MNIRSFLSWRTYKTKIRLAFLAIALLLLLWVAFVVGHLNLALQEVRYLQEVVVPMKVQALQFANAINNSKASLYRYALSFSAEDRHQAFHYLNRQNQPFTAQSALDSLLLLRNRLAKTPQSEHAFYLIQDIERAFYDVSDQYKIIEVLDAAEQKGLIMGSIVGELRALNTLSESLVRESSSLEKLILEQSAWAVHDLLSKNFYMLFFLSMLTISIFGATLLLLLWLVRSFDDDVVAMKDGLHDLWHGAGSTSQITAKNEEFREVIHALKQFIYELEKIDVFATQAANGHLHPTLEAFPEDSPRGQALRKLAFVLSEEQLLEEEQHWLENGLSQITNVVKESTQDLERLCDSVLHLLIVYGDFCQGAVYMYDRAQQMLDMKASYAYGRKRHQKHQIIANDGLIGEAFSDQESIMMTEIPAGYSHVLIGVGEIAPTAIFIVPLSHQGQAIGAMELASTRTFTAIEQSFVLKTAEIFASNLLNVINRALAEDLIDRLMQSTRRMNEQDAFLKKALEESSQEKEKLSKQLQSTFAMLEAHKMLILQHPLPLAIAHASNGNIMASSPALKSLCHAWFTAYPNSLGIFQLLPALRQELAKQPNGQAERIQLKVAQDKTLSVDIRYYTTAASPAYLAVWIDAHH